MTPALNEFYVRYQDCLARCRIFDTDTKPAVQIIKNRDRKELWLARGLEEGRSLEKFRQDQRLAREPLPILGGGFFNFFITCREAGEQADIPSYTLRFLDLKTTNGIHSFRYDKDLGVPRGQPDWDADLKDAPSHPGHHLHINFTKPENGQYEPDNDLRLPTGPVDPLMVLLSVDHWYSRLLGL